ncbi:Protein CBG28099 [Caenorhabditis briggsae]|uniref:Protein CBG28099 n=1 Tax=Caenorhabditis briggsae TaxID=6238 RepID=B6IGT8_CAEBR|nr:Protein CBG28099 [Caenorhabditis briggsae]CAR99118.1 Protein CBG28099 [Caenorhabditis briggsae]
MSITGADNPSPVVVILSEPPPSQQAFVPQPTCPRPKTARNTRLKTAKPNPAIQVIHPPSDKRPATAKKEPTPIASNDMNKIVAQPTGPRPQTSDIKYGPPPLPPPVNVKEDSDLDTEDVKCTRWVGYRIFEPISINPFQAQLSRFLRKVSKLCELMKCW